MLEQLAIYIKNELRHRPCTHHKNLELTWDLHVKHKTIELLEDDIGGNDDLGYGSDFLHTALKVRQSTKEIIYNLEFIIVKNLCSVRQCQENENTSHREGKIFSKDTSDKDLLSNIYKELLKLNDKKVNNRFKKMGKWP